MLHWEARPILIRLWMPIVGMAPRIAVGGAAPGPKRPFQKVISRVLAQRRRSFPGPGIVRR